MSPVRTTGESVCPRKIPYPKSRRQRRYTTDHYHYLNLCQVAFNQKTIKEDKLREEIIDSEEISDRCQRNVFYPDLEASFDSEKAGPYYIACKEFYQNINKTGSESLPRRVCRAPWQSIKSVVHLTNPALSRQFEAERARLLKERKVDEHGLVRETLLFHGSENEKINIILEENFRVDQQPGGGREKAMLFGRGVYMSPLPGVSLMYGETLLLCKVLLGKCQTYQPTGAPPPEIPEEFDSRIIMRDGMAVVIVLKKPQQILPFCILNVKRELFSQAGNVNVSQQSCHKVAP